jgi:hypothetical protein
MVISHQKSWKLEILQKFDVRYVMRLAILGRRPFPPLKVLINNDGEELVDLSSRLPSLKKVEGGSSEDAVPAWALHFQNTMAHNPVMSYEKKLAILEFIRQANLDAFWCEAKMRVAVNLQAGLQMEKMANEYGMPWIAPPMGPFPLEDSMGIMAARVDPIVYLECVQRGTSFCKIHFEIINIGQAVVHSNASQAGVLSLAARFGGSLQEKTCADFYSGD